MITKDLISETYIRKIVARDSGIIYETQADVISRHLNVRSGRLQTTISHKYFNVSGTNFTFKVLNYMRFLDMKKMKRASAERKDLALYNRVIYGVLYRETLPDIINGLTKDMRETITAELQAEGKNLEIK